MYIFIDVNSIYLYTVYTAVIDPCHAPMTFCIAEVFAMAARKSTSASASCGLSHDEFHCADAMTLLQCVLKDIPPRTFHLLMSQQWH